MILSYLLSKIYSLRHITFLLSWFFNIITSFSILSVILKSCLLIRLKSCANGTHYIDGITFLIFFSRRWHNHLVFSNKKCTDVPMNKFNIGKSFQNILLKILWIMNQLISCVPTINKYKTYSWISSSSLIGPMKCKYS